MGKIKVAIAGVGNCASSLIQGLEYYNWVNEESGFVSGIISNTIKGYQISDIKIVAAFDVDQNKVGKDLSEAIFSGHNCATKFTEVPFQNVAVLQAPVLDGLGRNLKKIISINSKHNEVCISDVLVETEAELLINFLPTGSKRASEFYAEQAIKAECGFINGIPEVIACSLKWRKKFFNAGLPLVGDDVKSQLGGTNLHRDLVELFLKWGCKINRTYQSNVGGNTDFLNLTESSRSKTKISCKNNSIRTLIPYITEINVDIMSHKKVLDTALSDPKSTIIHIEGENFGSRPVSVDVELHVEDSPNSAGVMVDIIRAMKVALIRHDSGAIDPICSHLFKCPPSPSSDQPAYIDYIKYIKD